MQNREQITIELISALKEQGFVESGYVKPNTIFTNNGNRTQVLLNRKDGAVSFGRYEFKGHRYPDSINFFNSLSDKA